MSRVVGSLAERGVLEVVHELYARRESGVLEIESAGQRRRLYFVAGQLHLPGGHPLAQRLAQELAAVRAGLRAPDSESEAARARLLGLVERIAGVLAEWREGKYRFQPLGVEAATDLIGPLPTRRLLMLSTTRGLSVEELLARLGGEDAVLAAGVDAEGALDLLGLSPEERFLVERLRLPQSVQALLTVSPAGPHEVLQKLVQLRAVGLVVRHDESALDKRRRERDEQMLLERLDDRIRASLEEAPVALDEVDHRARVADLLARFGGMDHYELLGLPTSAPEARVQEAYEQIARLVHASHAPRLGLVGREGLLDMLFERVTSAFRTLSDPERRRRYNADQLIDLSPALGASDRRQEARALARSHHDRALAYSSAGDVHSAIQLLEQAAHLDPRAEYYGALGRHLARNQKWRGRALEAYRAALELDPQSPEIRFEMGVLQEGLGDLGRARASFSAALRADPSHAGAREHLAKLGGSGAGRGEDPLPRGGLFDRIFRKR